MRFQRIVQAVNHEPWFISAAGYESVKTLLVRALAGNEKALGLEDFIRQRPPMSIDPETGIATIHILGVLGQHLSNVEKSCGATGFEDIESEIEQALDLRASGILFVIDSPGGACTGGEECAKVISDCPIPTVAFTSGQACSMGYYLAAGCDAVVASPSAGVGNIGVICPWVDSSKLWEVNGLQFAPITNTGADLKSTMHGPEITEPQREFIQSHVDHLARMFHDHVVLKRVVDDEVWKAGWYMGERALELGLIDQIGREKDAVFALEMLISDSE